jgi:predicted acyltransferase
MVNQFKGNLASATNDHRIRAIDSFRGVTVIFMVFFTMILPLSDSLPWPLIHGVPGTIRPGDFVLSMFLFASGMSIVYFDRKRKTSKTYVLDIIERFGKFILIWFFLSPLSAGEFLGMDEIMLNLLLFIPTLLLIKFSDNELAITGLAIFILYGLLQLADVLPDFTVHYLGGYAGAIFYLPVMLAGVIAGRNIDKIKNYLLPIAILSILLLFIFPPYKNLVTPSFMAFSILISLIGFKLSEKLDIREIEYLGRDPIRYWVLMFVVLAMPLLLIVDRMGLDLPLQMDWQTATALTLAGVVALYIISKIFDWFMAFVKEIEIVEG